MEVEHTAARHFPGTGRSKASSRPRRRSHAGSSNPSSCDPGGTQCRNRGSVLAPRRAIESAVGTLHDARHGSKPVGAVEAVERGELWLGESLWLARDQCGQAPPTAKAMFRNLWLRVFMGSSLRLSVLPDCSFLRRAGSSKLSSRGRDGFSGVVPPRRFSGGFAPVPTPVGANSAASRERFSDRRSWLLVPVDSVVARARAHQTREGQERGNKGLGRP